MKRSDGEDGMLAQACRRVVEKQRAGRVGAAGRGCATRRKEERNMLAPRRCGIFDVECDDSDRGASRVIFVKVEERECIEEDICWDGWGTRPESHSMPRR